MKVLIFFITLNCYLFSYDNFKETRYIAAFDIEQYKYGKMHINKQYLTLSYTQPTVESISYYNDRLVISKNDQTKEYSFSKYPSFQYMGLILRAIIEDDFSSLDELFEIKEDNKTIILKSKPIIYDTIEFITVIKNKTIIKQIILNMVNQDKITIETID